MLALVLSLLTEKYEPVNVKWTTERCAVCRWVEDWDYNKIIICNRCCSKMRSCCSYLFHHILGAIVHYISVFGSPDSSCDIEVHCSYYSYLLESI